MRTSSTSIKSINSIVQIQLPVVLVARAMEAKYINSTLKYSPPNYNLRDSYPTTNSWHALVFQQNWQILLWEHDTGLYTPHIRTQQGKNWTWSSLNILAPTIMLFVAIGSVASSHSSGCQAMLYNCKWRKSNFAYSLCQTKIHALCHPVYQGCQQLQIEFFLKKTCKLQQLSMYCYLCQLQLFT